MSSENGVVVPNPEVEARPKRRRFTAGYKARILREAERCRKPGETCHLTSQLHRAGFGRDQGRDALEKYTQTKSVWVNLS